MKKIIALGVLLVMCLGIFAGCGGNKYNAKILDSSDNFHAFHNEDYFESTFGVKDEPENTDKWWGTDTDGWWNYSPFGKSLVHLKALIIDEKSDADAAFDSFPEDFNFEKEMIICCYFAEPSQWIKKLPGPYKLKNVRIEGSTLKFTFEAKGNRGSAQGRSNQVSKLIKLDKFDITDVQFEVRYVG